MFNWLSNIWFLWSKTTFSAILSLSYVLNCQLINLIKISVSFYFYISDDFCGDQFSEVYMSHNSIELVPNSSHWRLSISKKFLQLSLESSKEMCEPGLESLVFKLSLWNSLGSATRLRQRFNSDSGISASFLMKCQQFPFSLLEQSWAPAGWRYCWIMGIGSRNWGPGVCESHKIKNLAL